MNSLRYYLVLALCAYVFTSWAYDFKVGGIFYNITSSSNPTGTVEVTYGDVKYSGLVKIPSYIYFEEKYYYVTKIGTYAFQECDSLINITLPESITEIGNSAFLRCSRLSEIIIPNGVLTIAGSTFNRCTSLSSVSIPNSVTNISSNAFYRCKSLESIVIPDKVTSIGNNVFYECESLTSINIPNSVNHIGTNVFEGCSALTEVTVGCNWDTNPLYTFNENVSVKTSHCFEYGVCEDCGKQTTITVEILTEWWNDNFPNGYEEIETATGIRVGQYKESSTLKLRNAYNQYITLVNEGLGDATEILTLSKIAKNELQKNELVEGYYYITSYRENAGILDDDGIMRSVPNFSIPTCNSTGDVTVNAVSYQCIWHISPVEGKENSYLIQNYRTSKFAGIDSENSNTIVTSEDGVSYIISDVMNEPGIVYFYHTTEEGKLDCSWNVYGGYYDYIIGNWLNGGEPEKDNGNHFYLTPISEDELLSFDTNEPLTGLCGEHLTYNLDVNKCLLTISGTGSMYDYDWKTENAPWRSAEHLIDHVIIESGVTSVGDAAFKNCIHLKSVTLPAGIISIGDCAFYRTSLKSISIPKTVTSIENNAFSYCDNLSEVISYIPAEELFSIPDIAFYGSYDSCVLKVPSGAKTIYETTGGWKLFNEIVEDIFTLTDGIAYENEEYIAADRVSYSRTLPNLKWNALYLPIEVPVDTLRNDYEVAYINDVHSFDTNSDGIIDNMEMEIIKITEGTLNANYPYLIKAKNEEAKVLNLEFTNTTLYPAIENSVMCSSMFLRFDIRGTYSRKEQKDYPNTYVITTTGEWSPMIEGTALNPYRLYLEITELGGSPVKVSPQAMQKIRMREVGESNTTRIESATNSSKLGLKTMFDLSGRRVVNPNKGVYIVDGKKVIFK